MNADSPPVIPVDFDAYLQWAQWPLQRIGVRGYLRSTYDRTGHNHTADASHYLYQVAEDFNVTLDVEGGGILYFVRTNHWHGSPWHYEIDGVDHIVSETTTADPTRKLERATFIPEAPFPEPLTFTYTTTHGADLSWVPIPFADRLRIAYSRTFYGTGYYIYHQLVPGIEVSRAVAPWDGARVPEAGVLDVLRSTGADLVAGDSANRYRGRAALTAHAITALVEIRAAPSSIRWIELVATADRAVELGAARLVITWDDRAEASVDAPLDLFFGAGTLHNRDGREWLVKALPVAIRFANGLVRLTCRFPMPFFRSARVSLVAGHEGAPIDVEWAIVAEPYAGPWNHVGYFHATYRDHAEPKLGHDLTFLDTSGIEGDRDWSGSIVGTSFVFTDRNVLTTLEGDPRFFFDDSRTPQVQGTGTEEWGGGGDYWGGRNMTLPLAGHPVGVVDARDAANEKDLIHSAYRFLLADLLPFGFRAVVGFEHGGENESTEHYRSVTHWYGLPSASLVLTDTLSIGDAASERAHGYRSPDASAPYEIVSRYEWGPDHLSRSMTAPLANPDHWVDYAFDAPRGRYHVWVELETGDEFVDAAVWVQVNDDIGVATVRAEYMGTGGFANLGREPNAFRFQTAIAPSSVVDLARDGRQRLRIQPRIGRATIGRVLLGRSRTSRPDIDVRLQDGDVLLTARQIAARGGAFDVRPHPGAPGREAIVLFDAPAEIEIYPSEALHGRWTRGVSEFELAIRADNRGVMLRRTLDYAFANQRATVEVATADGWTLGGIWYLAGSNTVYHSFPFRDGELGASRATVMTSNRRLRDDEFLLPLELTRGRDRIRLRIAFAERNPPLLPGRRPDPSAWSEIAYRAYSFVMPRVELDS